MIKVKAIEKEIETMEDFTDKINEFIKDKNVTDIQFIKRKETQIICFIIYNDYTDDDYLPF